MSFSSSLAGKNALVTGASGGIGKGIAAALARNGCNVLVHYNTRKEGAISTCQSIQSSAESNNNSNQGKCDGILRCDFRNPDAIDKMFHVVDDIWGGKIDILVNNAGVVTKSATQDDADMTKWYETMAVNLHAPLQLSKLAHNRMKQNNGGSIINVSSIHGSLSVEYMTAYAASKAALDQLTKGLSCEWAADGVRVNSVAPGVVPVERTAAVLNEPEAQDLWRPHLPVGRMGTVEDVADAVVYLCSSEWVSGSVMTIDGGMSARANMPFRPRPNVAVTKKDDLNVEIRSDIDYETLS